MKSRAIPRKQRCTICRNRKEEPFTERPGGGQAHVSCLSAWEARRLEAKVEKQKWSSLTPEQREAMAKATEELRLQSKVIAAIEAAKAVKQCVEGRTGEDGE